MDTIVQFAAYGFIVLWCVAWWYAFMNVSWSTLQAMINDSQKPLLRGFTINGLVWSAFCALLALLPLFIALWFWSEFSAAFPA